MMLFLLSLISLALCDFDPSTLGPRRRACDNIYLKNGTADAFICGNATIDTSMLPVTFGVNVTIELGPKSALCLAVLCAYKTMGNARRRGEILTMFRRTGCAPEMVRVQNTIKNAAGVIPSDCAADYGLGANTCEFASAETVRAARDRCV
jgi:hypothetical protein